MGKGNSETVMATPATTTTTTTTTNSKKKDHDDPGVGYLTQPYIMTKEEEEELLKESRRRLKILLNNDCHEDGWYHRFNIKGVNISSKVDKEGGSPFLLTKGTVAMPPGVSLVDIHKQFGYDNRSTDAVDRFFKRMDPMTLQMALITEIKYKELLDPTMEEECRVIWGAFAIAPLVHERDFCFVQHVVSTSDPVTGDPLRVVNAYSMKHPAVPDMQKSIGRIRADIEATGYIFRPLPDNKMTLTYVLQVNPGGWLPTSIVNLASVSQALNVGRIRESYEQYLHAAKMLSVTKFPLERYELPRGGHAIYKIPLLEFDQKEEEGAGRLEKTIKLRLCAFANHAVSVKLQIPSSSKKNGSPPPYTLTCVNGKEDQNKEDVVGKTLLSGKSIDFGTKKCPSFSAIVEVTISAVNQERTLDETEETIQLVFTNASWRKTSLYIPADSTVPSSTTTTSTP